MQTASWVIVEKATGRAVLETFDPSAIAKINARRYEAIPILQYLYALNARIRTAAAPR